MEKLWYCVICSKGLKDVSSPVLYPCYDQVACKDCLNPKIRQGESDVDCPTCGVNVTDFLEPVFISQQIASLNDRLATSSPQQHAALTAECYHAISRQVSELRGRNEHTLDFERLVATDIQRAEECEDGWDCEVCLTIGNSRNEVRCQQCGRANFAVYMKLHGDPMPQSLLEILSSQEEKRGGEESPARETAVLRSEVRAVEEQKVEEPADVYVQVPVAEEPKAINPPADVSEAIKPSPLTAPNPPVPIQEERNPETQPHKAPTDVLHQKDCRCALL